MPGEHVSILFSGTVDRNCHSLFFWGFPMASLSPVMVFPPASLVLVSVGCVRGPAKATTHLSGIVLLFSDPYVMVMGSLISYVCKYTDLYQFQYMFTLC